MSKVRVFSSHVETNSKLEEHTAKVNKFLDEHKVVKVTHNCDSNKFEAWFAGGISQIVITTVEYLDSEP